ncbi:SDR family NAD(P)-dependent oxidoreductase [Bradyrhizobium viridifuturi]|nr:SDR family NAD(P)-dependent oxidoreductase [Bradyrhizobium viridifuturi]MBR1074946.1 SDR family NAD(P)-dependent oxidoreductase [Bradyrhizobium viridifuturi]
MRTEGKESDRHRRWKRHRAVCIRFAEEGSEVAVFDLNEGGARQTVRTIKDAGGKAHGYTVDITDRKALDAAVAHYEAGDAIDVPVNIAGW